MTDAPGESTPLNSSLLKSISPIGDLVRDVVRADVQRQLPGQLLTDRVEIAASSIRLGATYSTMLALSGFPEDRRAAYDLATRLSHFAGDYSSETFLTSQLTLARLGNFPATSLFEQRYPAPSERALSVPLQLERLLRQQENTLVDGERLIPLTDFQSELIRAIEEFEAVSVSAPTSAGKSYILALEIGRFISANPSGVVVVVVPTRALVRQVSIRIRDELLETGNTSANVFTGAVSSEVSAGSIFVLTQERLRTLLGDSPPASVDLLVVDEAQGIADGARGVLLESVVRAVLREYPSCRVLFASPLTNNPSYLISLFLPHGKQLSWIEENSPVSQNLIYVEEVAGRPSRASFKLQRDTEVHSLGECELDFRFREPVLKRRANFAHVVTRPGESTLIYANQPSHAEDIAQELSQLVEPVDSPDLRELSEFIREHIHPEYTLQNYLLHGVAFHYGNMPALIRSRIEELSEDGIIRFICCTSTLLQGVNLPAKHIIMEAPTRGVGKPISRQDFLNLAGRAGRLMKEFSGNVWCLCPSRWNEGILEGAQKTQIESAMHNVMTQNLVTVEKMLLGERLDDEEEQVAVAVASELYTDFSLRGRLLLNSDYRTIDNERSLQAVQSLVNAVNSELPRDLLRRNSSIFVTRLEALKAYLDDIQNLDDYLPKSPFASDFYDQLVMIFGLVSRILDESDNQSYRYYAQLANRWLRGDHLRVIAAQAISYARENRQDHRPVSTIIRELFRDIDENVRYHYSRDLRAYQDVLCHVLESRNELAKAESIRPLHSYLDLGTCEPSVIQLMTLGLSRTTALMLKNQMPPETDNPLSALQGSDLSSLPGICRREVSRVFGI